MFEPRETGLKKINQWPTYPQLIIKGEFVGGLDVVKDMVEAGELKELVAEA
jgi:glutaredoxin-related protein